jgi:hypothetical protein
LNARFSKNAIAQLPSVLLRMDGDPQFLASSGVSEEPVTALAASHFDVSGGFELPDYLSPGHHSRLT